MLIGIFRPKRIITGIMRVEAGTSMSPIKTIYINASDLKLLPLNAKPKNTIPHTKKPKCEIILTKQRRGVLAKHKKI